MEIQENIIEYKCPCCGAGLRFSGGEGTMNCEYCGNQFDLETVQACQDLPEPGEDTEDWVPLSENKWSDDEREYLSAFVCSSCGGELTTDDETVATFCPFCGNPAILPSRVRGDIKPDGVLPFVKSKEDAKSALLALCKGKLLLPKDFTANHRIEKMTGLYVPFWLYNCDTKVNARYNATRIHHWSDSRYNYTRTDHYLLVRGADASFASIPMDGSSKMDDVIMESIEPFDYSGLVDFNTAYLSGFFADKYDVPSEEGQPKVKERSSNSLEEALRESMLSYTTAVPSRRQFDIRHGSCKYVLLPVWMLNTKYKDQEYLFAMNAQTGKMAGTFPISREKCLAWFLGVSAAVSALAMVLIQLIA